jgi:hypothetical protein
MPGTFGQLNLLRPFQVSVGIGFPTRVIFTFLYIGKYPEDDFHSCTVHLDAIKVFYLPTDAPKSCFKRILRFTLKQLLHVSVQSPSSGSVLFELAKIIVFKIIS